MPNYGFVIDNRKCIGCHACSTACKSENEVPLGVNRTWVKYVETGVYPNTRRHFQVTRCNHCANPPCVRICPVTAMYQRVDGIVEFDPEICIGCKACMQACPYDAIYIDPDTGTAAKCHYCGHRTEVGLEPACVVVCPVHAIISGDIDDPKSEISHVIAETQVTVRKPEQGTAPKLFYVNGSDITMHPTATERTPESFMWADVIPLHHESDHDGARRSIHNANGNPLMRRSHSGTDIRLPQSQGTPLAGPIQIGGRVADHMVQVAYNAQHLIPWHWPVPAYLVTKGIGAGVFMLLSLGAILGLFPFEELTYIVGGFLSLLFVGITTGLLVYDLEKPERFISIVFRPQWKSWLARGAFILIGFSILSGIWWLIETAAYLGLLPSSVSGVFRIGVMWAGLPFAIGAAVYTAFLFGQSEGRDLWQSTLLPLHLIVQSLMVGSGIMILVGLFIEFPVALSGILPNIFISMIVLDLLVTLFGEFGMPHASEQAAKAAHEISHGRYKNYFWWGSIVIGHLMPLLFLLFANPILATFAVLGSVVGMYLYEYAFVMAPQEIPNS